MAHLSQAVANIAPFVSTRMRDHTTRAREIPDGAGAGAVAAARSCGGGIGASVAPASFGPVSKSKDPKACERMGQSNG